MGKSRDLWEVPERVLRTCWSARHGRQGAGSAPLRDRLVFVDDVLQLNWRVLNDPPRLDAQLQLGPRCQAVASCPVRLQLADDVDRELARHPLDLRLLAQLLLYNDALAAPRAFPQLNKDQRLAQRGLGTTTPGSGRLVLVLQPVLARDFQEREGNLFATSLMICGLSLFVMFMSL